VAEASRPIAFNQGCRGLVPSHAVDIRFFRYQLSAMSERLAALGQGSTFLELSGGALAGAPVVVPPLSVQSAIADYLDRETARIDSLIAAKKRMVELLTERFWSDVTHRVASRTSTFVPLRRYITRITDGPFGSSLTSSDYADSGARVVRLGNLGLAEFRPGDAAYISCDYYLTLQRHRVRKGDLLIGGLGDNNNHVGRACVAPDLGPAIVKADCYCAHVDDSRATAEFLALYLSSPLGAWGAAWAARGTTRSRINLDIAKDIPVPTIALSAQTEIVAGARRDRARAETLSRRLNSQNTLLQERRQAFVTAAVTGQLDIPEAA